MTKEGGDVPLMLAASGWESRPLKCSFTAEKGDRTTRLTGPYLAPTQLLVELPRLQRGRRA